MNKVELIGKLQMVYVGDRNALDELVGYYDGLQEVIKLVREENKQLKENWNKLRDYLFDIRQRGFELQNIAEIHNVEPNTKIIMIIEKMDKIASGDSNE